MSEVPAEIIRHAATRRNAAALRAADGLALARFGGDALFGCACHP